MKRFRTCGAACAVALLAIARVSAAATITVSPGDDYTKIEAAQAGDEVVIAPGTYQFRVNLENSGTAQAPIRIRAADPANPPVWDLSGTATGDWPGSYGAGDAGRGCWQIRGDHYEISDIVFTGCRDTSGSAVRAVNVTGVRLTHCGFFNSTNGVTGTAEGFVIEHSEFAGNGRPFQVGDNPSHNLYIFGGTLALRYNLFHNCEEGQNFHVRARDAVIEYNWFSSPGSYMGDMMTCEHFCGGGPGEAITQRMLLRGNVILQGNPVNLSQIIALYNDEGGSGDDTGNVASMELVMVYNTIVGTTVAAGHEQRLVNLRNDSVDTHVVLDNNVIHNVRDVAEPREPGQSNWSISGTNNWVSTGTAASELAANVEGLDPGFENGASDDYRPASSSPLLDAAGVSSTGVPTLEYFQNEDNARMYRVRASADDIGAFEYGTTGDGIGPGGDPFPDAGTGGGAGSGGSAGTGGGPGGSGGSGGGSAGTGGSAAAGGSAGEDGGAGSSGASTGGTSGSSAKPTATADDDGSCGCRLGSTRSPRGTLLLAFAMVLLALRRMHRTEAP